MLKSEIGGIRVLIQCKRSEIGGMKDFEGTLL